MLKVKAATKDDSWLYLFGLNAMNIKELKKGRPIHFSGDEVHLPGHWFLIICEADKKAIEQQHEAHAREGQHLHVIALDEGSLDALKVRPVELPAQRMKIEGKLLLVAAETNVELGRLLDIEVAPEQIGYRDEFDPISGRIVRKPEDAP